MGHCMHSLPRTKRSTSRKLSFLYGVGVGGGVGWGGGEYMPVPVHEGGGVGGLIVILCLAPQP